jgi:hypothetical protein
LESNLRNAYSIVVDIERLKDLKSFYELLGLLEKRIGGARRLANCTGKLSWPERGVYFFMEDSESRTDTGLDRALSVSAPTPLGRVQEQGCGPVCHNIAAAPVPGAVITGAQFSD